MLWTKSFWCFNIGVNRMSDITYEELTQKLVLYLILYLIWSDITYEELTPVLHYKPISCKAISCRTLPMRN